MKVTIKDVAKASGVSTTTVSRIINNIEGSANEETKKRVLKTVKELNYKPNELARSLVTKKTKTMALMLPDITNPFFPSIAKSVEKSLNKLGYSLILCNSYDNKENEDNYIRILQEKYVDGIILSSSHIKEDNKLLRDSNIPIVFIDRKADYDVEYGVFVKNFEGAYSATKYLIGIGHKNIGCIIGPKEINTTKERLDGYIKALDNFHIRVNQEIIKCSEYSIEGGYIASKELLKNKDITAIFAQDDLIACGVYKAAKEMGLKIPNDLSVVGFDDISIVEVLDPPLTTIKQHTEDIGSIAVEMIMNLIDNKEVKEKIVTIDTDLIKRGSTKGI
ncbi:LacI family DNA-binding transcriptional regulator [Clostridium algidicarnis]|mgnify:CR=1 FL=1|uniref:LacI family DNA-binding transcriptional regulator n=1 Tax=Clostridium algidicarnis TaxID=37659 RepID=UPI003FD87FA7